VADQEFTVSDELYEISEATNKDGTVDVEIYDFRKRHNDEVVVRFRTPTGDVKTESMKWPKRDTTEYKFVRICRETAGSLSGAKFLKTDGGKIRADPEEWELKADLTTKDKIKEFISQTSIRSVLENIGWGVVMCTLISSGFMTLGSPVLASLQCLVSFLQYKG
jgi:hypothetical protein